jgi:hypothetical protein
VIARRAAWIASLATTKRRDSVVAESPTDNSRRSADGLELAGIAGALVKFASRIGGRGLEHGSPKGAVRFGGRRHAATIDHHRPRGHGAAM